MRISSSLALWALLIMAFTALVSPAVAQVSQAVPELGNVSNATVTLYYYDQASGKKGAMVPMPDNPQQVMWDPQRAAPGMYTFAHVPTGNWYYLEADNNGHKWYAVFFMAPGVGTHTANVHIPPFQPANVTIAPTPVATPTTTPTVTPAASTPTLPAPTPSATPGLTPIFAMIGLILAALLYTLRK